MAQIKKELLEHLIRTCVREILDQVNELDDTVGAPAPPAAGLGTADQPSIPQETPPQAPTVQASNKGVVLVNPKDPAKLVSLPVKYMSDAQLERDLHKIGASLAGPRVKTSMNAMRLSKDASRNPSSPVYLYIGKYDPESDEIFLMADKDLNSAKSNSLSPTELGFTPTTATPFEPTTASPDDFATRMSSGGATPKYGVDELKVAIKNIVKEIFTK